MIKRHQGSFIRARTWWIRCREQTLRVLTPNIKILWWDTLFSRISRSSPERRITAAIARGLSRLIGF
jgi:hypothetical protein